MKKLMTFILGLLISSTSYARCGWAPYCGEDADPVCVAGNTWKCVPKTGGAGSSNSLAEMESGLAFAVDKDSPDSPDDKLQECIAHCLAAGTPTDGRQGLECFYKCGGW